MSDKPRSLTSLVGHTFLNYGLVLLTLVGMVYLNTSFLTSVLGDYLVLYQAGQAGSHTSAMTLALSIYTAVVISFNWFGLEYIAERYKAQKAIECESRSPSV